jgi:hypothetical protein
MGAYRVTLSANLQRVKGGLESFSLLDGYTDCIQASRFGIQMT